MADLNIRNVDIRLMVRLKSDALMAGLTLREHCIHLLSKTGGRQAEVGEDDTPGEVQDADVAVERSESVAVVSEVRGRVALGRERVEGGMPEAVRVRPEVVVPVSAEVSLDEIIAMMATPPEVVPEPITSCTYEDLPNEAGDIFGCGKPLGHKGLHGNMRKLRDIWA